MGKYISGVHGAFLVGKSYFRFYVRQQWGMRFETVYSRTSWSEPSVGERYMLKRLQKLEHRHRRRDHQEGRHHSGKGQQHRLEQ
jgi:hypothetical protein